MSMSIDDIEEVVYEYIDRLWATKQWDKDEIEYKLDSIMERCIRRYFEDKE